MKSLLAVLLAVGVLAQQQKPGHVYSGATTSNLPWVSDGAGSLAVEVNTRLQLTSVPTYLCRIVHRFSAMRCVSAPASCREPDPTNARSATITSTSIRCWRT